jgi:hypothetical protein
MAVAKLEVKNPLRLILELKGYNTLQTTDLARREERMAAYSVEALVVGSP